LAGTDEGLGAPIKALVGAAKGLFKAKEGLLGADEVSESQELGAGSRKKFRISDSPLSRLPSSFDYGGDETARQVARIAEWITGHLVCSEAHHVISLNFCATEPGRCSRHLPWAN
jgi:hypothetical protein